MTNENIVEEYCVAQEKKHGNYPRLAGQLQTLLEAFISDPSEKTKTHVIGIMKKNM